MKKFIGLFLVLSVNIVVAQTDSVKQVKKPKTFIATVNTISGKMDRGLIYLMEDSTITLKTLPGLKTNFSSRKKLDQYSLNSYAFENIATVTIRRKNATKRSLLIGAGIGMVTGAVSGLISGDDQLATYDPANDFFGFGGVAVAVHNMFAMTAGEKALAYGMAGALGGGITGLIIGAIAKKKFFINTDKPKFEAMKLSVLERTYGK
jgi:hypothetical protein